MVRPTTWGSTTSTVRPTNDAVPTNSPYENGAGHLKKVDENGTGVGSSPLREEHYLENGTFGSKEAQPRRSFWRKYVDWNKKYWWVHLINFLLGFMIITLCLAYLAVPAIAQHDINHATLVLRSQAAVNPTPDSVQIQMTTESHSSSHYHPRLDAFRAALFLEDTEPNIVPFAYLNIPSITAGANVTIYIQQELEIIDIEQFGRYNSLVMSSETYRVALRGRVAFKEIAFPKSTVDFNQVVESKGFNGLKGLEIRNISIDATGGLNGQVYIPNPSPITITMGTVTQNVYVDGQLIGLSTIPDLTLVPGDNLLQMSSTSDTNAVLNFVTTKYTDGKLPVTIRGNSSVVNGYHLPYYEKALQDTIISTTLDLGPALTALGLNLTSS